MAVYGYTRVSTSGQVDNTSLEEQTRKINAVAQYHGIKVDDIFREEGVSGSISLSLRPAGYKMLAQAQDRRYDHRGQAGPYVSFGPRRLGDCRALGQSGRQADSCRH
jgi:hypothetical protein